jgi:ribosomal protein S6--L-glutamate ligase
VKIAILSRGPDLYSTQRLKQAAELKGHQVDIIDTLRCYMNIASDKPSIHYAGKQLKHYDAIIPRVGASITFYGSAVVRQFEMMGVFTLNSSLGITRSRDKLRALQLLSRKGVGLPITGFARSPSDIDDLINMVGGSPLVVKLLEGTQGIGVVLAETKKAAQSVIQAFLGLNANIMLQEYIRESNGADIRCLVIGSKVVAAMKRQAAAGEFRSNLHQGGTAELIKITKEERETAIKAAKIMNLSVAGVDMLRSARGPLIMEVNSSPGLRGIEDTTKKDVAGLIIEYIENNARPIDKHSRYEG